MHQQELSISEAFISFDDINTFDVYNEILIKHDVKSLYKCVVVIPALNPMDNLVSFVAELINEGIPHVIVVNDGSAPAYDPIFKKLSTMDSCTLLVHTVNRGKGRALKTAISYFLENFKEFDGVVTADADGQHTVEDICRVSSALSSNQDSLILGMRNFRDKSVPKRSYMGNRLTSGIFRALYGSYIEDTQTGLRGIPKSALSWIKDLSGERYEFEINMLINSKCRNIPFSSVPIRTIYFNNNSGSHYSTLRDSFRIFSCLLSGFIKYSVSALVSGILDVLTFFILNSLLLLFLPAPERLLISTVIARIISSSCNFSINRKIFNAGKEKLPKLAMRYYSLWLVQLLTSFTLVYAVSLYSSIHDSVIKIIIDMLLGIISYQIQLRWVFKNKDVGLEV